MAKPPPAGRYDRVVEKPDHVAPRLADAGIGKNLAGHLYGERQWTMERIAEALDVRTRQISKDLEVLNLVQNLLAVPGQRDAWRRRSMLTCTRCLVGGVLGAHDGTSETDMLSGTGRWPCP